MRTPVSRRNSPTRMGRSGAYVWWLPTKRMGRWSVGTPLNPCTTRPSSSVEKNTGLDSRRRTLPQLDKRDHGAVASSADQEHRVPPARPQVWRRTRGLAAAPLPQEKRNHRAVPRVLTENTENSPRGLTATTAREGEKPQGSASSSHREHGATEP